MINLNQINYLESIAKRWTKGNHDRFYIRMKTVAKVEKYGENWNHYKVNGNDMANLNAATAREALRLFVDGQGSGGIYYDINDDTFYHGGNSFVQKVNSDIIKELRAKLNELKD